MATKIKIKMGKKNVTIVKESYRSNNRIALSGYTGRDNPYADFTTNIAPAPCGADYAYIDTNNVSDQDYKSLIENKIISKETYGSASSGFCTYPLHKVLI